MKIYVILSPPNSGNLSYRKRPMISSDNDILAKIIKAFRSRAKRLRWMAILIIVLIILVLSTGIAIFIFAGQLANSEAYQAVLNQKRERIDETKANLDNLNVELAFRRNEVARYEEQYINEITGAKDPKHSSGLVGYGPVARSLQERVLYGKNEVKKVEDKIAPLENQLTALQKDLQQTTELGVESISKQDQLSRVISAIATRIGSVIILLFLVKILVPLYRYNMKLAYYYDARADAIELLDGDSGYDRTVDIFERLTSTLTPSDIDFGPSPKSPSEEAVELAKQIINSKIGK